MTSSVAVVDAPLGDAPRHEPLLRVDGLSTSFPTPRGLLQAVDGVSFELAAGECIGMVGESGSGKSVLVRSIMGLLPPAAEVEGRVVFGGQDLAELSARAKRRLWGPGIAMVFQDPMTSLNPVRRIGVQLTDPLRVHLNLSTRQARLRAMELLDLVGIPEPSKRIDQYPHELSGGMRQRVMIAIAVSCQPRLLIADEPTTALDVTVQRQILDLLQNLQQDLGMAMILITHDLGVVAGRTRRVLVMYAGRVVEEAVTPVLFRQPRHPYSVGLLASIPRLEAPSRTRLESIPGRPPDMVSFPASCRFAARCGFVQDRCRAEDPPLLEIDISDHRCACFYPVGTQA